MIAKGWGWVGIGWRDNKGREETWGGGDEHLRCLDHGDFTSVYICQPLSNCTFKFVQVIVRQLFLNKAVFKKGVQFSQVIGDQTGKLFPWEQKGRMRKTR